ncbi:MAG: hypothetical protein ABIP75_03155 [Pyrinomonadaceae bacterium]
MDNLIPLGVEAGGLDTNKLRLQADEIIAGLQDEELWPDEKVYDLRAYSQELGSQAWRVQCACDAALLARAEMHLGGRGRADEAGTGSRALVRQLAKQLNVTAKTVYLNIQIHNTFLAQTGHNVVTSFDILPEKSFYIAALGAPDPQKAIRQIAEAKAADPSLSVRDANRLVRNSRKEHKRLTVGPALKSMQVQADRAFMEELRRTLNGLMERCPTPRVANQIHRWVGWTNDELDRNPERDRRRVINAWELGAYTATDMANETGMDPDYVEEILEDMKDKGLASWAPQGKTEAARGARTRVWEIDGKYIDSLHD